MLAAKSKSKFAHLLTKSLKALAACLVSSKPNSASNSCNRRRLGVTKVGQGRIRQYDHGRIIVGTKVTKGTEKLSAAKPHQKNAVKSHPKH